MARKPYLKKKYTISLGILSKVYVALYRGTRLRMGCCSVFTTKTTRRFRHIITVCWRNVGAGSICKGNVPKVTRKTARLACGHYTLLGMLGNLLYGARRAIWTNNLVTRTKIYSSTTGYTYILVRIKLLWYHIHGFPLAPSFYRLWWFWNM